MSTRSESPGGVTDSDVAVLLRQTQWALDEAAHDFPAGRVSAQRRAELAGSLEALATIVRASAPATVQDPEIRTAVRGDGEEAEARRAVADLPVSVVHLAEAEEPTGWRRTPATLCGAPAGEAVTDADVHYCKACARSAAKWSAS